MSKYKVLTVDDRRVDRILYMELLGHDNYEFFELDDGDRILSFLEENPVDLILLDWQMPRMGGLEAMKALKFNPDFSDIPVIIITGLEDDTILEKAFDYGGVDFLQKPVRKIELVARVDNAIRLYKTQQRILEQKERLERLNNIVTKQKEELESSIEIKEELAELKRLELQRQLDDNKRKLMTIEMESSKRARYVEYCTKEIQKNIELIKSDAPKKELIGNLKELNKSLEDLGDDANSWTAFKRAFESTHPDFFNKLMEVNPRLTALDLKHCAYMRMNVGSYELADILGVELKSIQMSRYRLKKKLKIDGNAEALRKFLMSL